MLRTLINQRLGRYTITELLGRGGMAAVYRATDTVLQRDVALKVLYPQYSDDQSLVERFTREAVTAAALEHPHIVPVYDVGEHEGMAYIAMKLLSGETLQDHLQRVGAIGPDELCRLLAPVADALDYAHSRGVIHRDIKPGNIFLCQTPSGAAQVMLTDFGIAKRLDAPGLTTTGALIGTPDYMAPEQIAGRPVDARTDVYALGMLAYRALTGRRAFDGSTQDVLMGHLYRQPPLPSAVAPGLPAALDPVLLRAVASDANSRFPSAGAFVRALGDTAAAASPAPDLPMAAYALGAPPPGINSAPTMVNPAIQIAPPPPPPQITSAPLAKTHTTIGSTGRQIVSASPR
ncbi:MAG: serine/threonine protein kinase, partial [Oscillochloris sp.]|nr:serine/threonine protein kinase [Oscillochloris sp.]